MKSISDLAVQCIHCGLCIEDCPTFKLSGSEMESPRGRITLMRAAEEGRLGWEEIRPHIDRCLGCLACETACPSGVHYGELVELAREKIDKDRPRPARRALIETVTRPWAMRLTGLATFGKRAPGFISRAISGQPAEAVTPLPTPSHLPPLDESGLPEVKGGVYFLEGCAMRTLFPRVHHSAKRLLRRVGFTVIPVQQGCCGSMHAHVGYLDQARHHAKALVGAMRGDAPIVVDSAGCGSTMKRYEELLGEEGANFAARVLDISEFLLQNGLEEQLKKARWSSAKPVTYHDACHLAHGQGVRQPPRALVEAIPGIDLVPLPESEMCCGSAGVYNALQPQIARALLDRKMENIESTGAEIVVMGNPGCHAWIAQGAREHNQQSTDAPKITVLHLAEALESAFIGLDPFL